jgi:hypothetical protein
VEEVVVVGWWRVCERVSTGSTIMRADNSTGEDLREERCGVVVVVVVVVVGKFLLFAGQHSYRSISADPRLDVKLKASEAP